MNPTREEILEIDRAKIRQARAMSEEDKLRAGVRMFSRMRRLMISGIRADFPEADTAEVERIFRERLVITKRIQDR